MKLLMLNLVFIAIFARVKSEIFSSTDEMANLKDNQEVLIEELENLVENLENDVEIIKNKLSSLKSEHSNFAKNPLKYVQIPLNAFIIIKSLSHDVEKIENELSETVKNFNNSIKKIRLPMSDFRGVLEGLIRLQKNYELKFEDLADGIIDGVKYRDKLSVDVLHALGSGMSEIDQEFGEKYLKLALKRAENDEKYEIYQDLFEIYYEDEKYEKSLEIIKKMIELDPENKELEKLKVEIELNMVFGEDKKRSHDPEIVKKQTEKLLSGTYKTILKERKILSQSCMQNRLQNSSTISKLFCRYHSTNSFTKIAPFKLEIVNNHPFVGIFHDIILESEIEVFKEIAIQRLMRAQVLNNDSHSIVSRHRVAKLGFLFEIQDESKTLWKVSRRVSDMSGLSIKTAEIWQVQNYGIGGHYSLHHDFAYDGQDFNLGTGNRILTALFYLSNVEKGGATVFPFLRLYVPPKKGSAVLWHNLSTSGDREYLTMHAACPVIVGSKWVANKWLHVYGQEFIRPCELERRPTDEDYDSKYWTL